LAVSIVVAFQFGIYGLVWCSVITSLIALFINTHYTAPFTNYSTKSQIFDLVPTLVLSGSMYLIMMLLITLLEDSTNIVKIFISGVAGISFYILTSYIFRFPSFIYLINTLTKKYV